MCSLPRPTLSGQVTTFYPAAEGTRDSGTTQTGAYLFTGIGAGPFTLTAQSDTGLISNVPGFVADTSVSVLLNAVMPPTGAISGTVLTAANTPVANPAIQVSSPALRFVASGWASLQGSYQLGGIPPGPVIVYSSDNVVWCSAAGTLLQAGTTAQINILCPGTGTVTGTIFDVDGIPRANINVEVSSLDNGGIYTVTPTNGQGVYQVTGFQAGNIRVRAGGDYGGDQSVGFTDSVLTSQTPAVVNVTLGSAYNLRVLGNFAPVGISLQGSDGYFFRTDSVLNLVGGGTSDGRLLNPYASSHLLSEAQSMKPASPALCRASPTSAPPPACSAPVTSKC